MVTYNDNVFGSGMIVGGIGMWVGSWLWFGFAGLGKVSWLGLLDGRSLLDWEGWLTGKMVWLRGDFESVSIIARGVDIYMAMGLVYVIPGFFGVEWGIWRWNIWRRSVVWVVCRYDLRGRDQPRLTSIRLIKPTTCGARLWGWLYLNMDRFSIELDNPNGQDDG